MRLPRRSDMTRTGQEATRRRRRLWRVAAVAGVAVAAAGAMFLATPAGAATLEGVDISHHQAERAPVNWAKVRASGQRFVFVKATEGQTYTDPTFHASYAGIRAAGMYRGAYHFASPNTTSSAAVRPRSRRWPTAGPAGAAAAPATRTGPNRSAAPGTGSSTSSA